MKSSQDPCSISHFNRMTELAIQLGQNDNQNWSYNPRPHQFCLQIADFNLSIRSISCIENTLNLLGHFSYLNGKMLSVPSAFRQIFLAIANKNAQNCLFFTEQDGKQLLLKCSLSFHPEFSIGANINQCVKYLGKTIPSFERALQAVGLKSKSNKFSVEMLKQKLVLKKNIITTMNSAAEIPSTQLFNQIQTQNSSVIRVKSVVQKNSEFPDKQSFNKKGGYFSVQKKNSIIHHNSGQKDEMELAWKSPNNITQHKSMLESKMQKEIQYVSRMVDDKFLLNYYVSETQPNLIFMNYVPTLLKDQIYNEKTSFSQLLNLGQQLIEAVSVLHKSGIVHRDLKPQNILIQGESVKIIDYAESALMSDTFNSQNFLGYTLPYSALECSLGKQEGFNKKQIDLWSVSIILYQMAFKSLPMFYTRWIGADILEIWRSSNDFSISPIYRKSRGLRGIEEVISLISIRGIQMNPKDRLSLVAYHKLLSHLQQFYRLFIR